MPPADERRRATDRGPVILLTIATVFLVLGGAALILNLAQLIVERQRGRIWVESEKNKGSTFYFSPPLAR